MEIESNGSVLASQPSGPTRISMLMTDPRVGTSFNTAATNAFASVDGLVAGNRDERRRSQARMTVAVAPGAGPRLWVSSLLVEKSAQVRFAFDPRQGSAPSLNSLPSTISNGASADDAGTAYGPVRFQEHPPAA
jgi:hypothetical protein